MTHQKLILYDNIGIYLQRFFKFNKYQLYKVKIW